MLAEVQVKNFLLAATRGEASLSPSVVEEFARDCREVLEKQFNRDPKWRIRMSGLGRPMCQQVHGRDGKDEEMTYNAILRFLIGDLVECAVMAILKGAGVNITEAQGRCELELGGEQVQGTLDLIIDDPVDGEKVWDVKSASPYSYAQKFSKGYDNLKEDDPFGYLMQGHLYAEAKGKDFGGWIVVDKSSGEIQFVQAPDDQDDDRKLYIALANNTVESLQSGFTYTKPPIEPEEEMYTLDGKRVATGNKLLNRSCTFCGYRKHCWPKAVQHERVTSRARNKPVVWYHTLKVKEL
jgi:hypothetical protein